MNKIISITAITVLSLSTALITAFLSGCEVNPASSKVNITPDSVSMTKGQTQLFTASGGYDYTWSLGNEGMGVLSTRSGSQTKYTSLYTPSSNGADQILYVVSTIPNNVGGSSSTSTNAHSSANNAGTNSAEAFIKNLP